MFLDGQTDEDLLIRQAIHHVNDLDWALAILNNTKGEDDVEGLVEVAIQHVTNRKLALIADAMFLSLLLRKLDHVWSKIYTGHMKCLRGLREQNIMPAGAATYVEDPLASALLDDLRNSLETKKHALAPNLVEEPSHAILFLPQVDGRKLRCVAIEVLFDLLG